MKHINVLKISDFSCKSNYSGVEAMLTYLILK